MDLEMPVDQLKDIWPSDIDQLTSEPAFEHDTELLDLELIGHEEVRSLFDVLI